MVLISAESRPQVGATPAFQNSYAELPERFYARLEGAQVSTPRTVRINEPLARQLGLDVEWLAGADGVQMLAGNRFPVDATPIALAYAGHQFGHFVPQLGDGRALLIGELVDLSGIRRDVQLKGSGPTQFSRNGDGRAALGPVLREYIVSEAMDALGIPTTRALAAMATGDRVYRDRRLPGAILTRVAASHIRIGTFQYFAARGDVEGVKALADYAIARHYPDATQMDNRYRALLGHVVNAQAQLIARWMLVGFIHGVMNTDNMTISGETIDYGPCAFMDGYNPAAVFSSIDANGRYAYGNQPRIAVWNLTRFAETLLPLLDEDQNGAIAIAEAELNRFQGSYEATFHHGLRRKVGLMTAEPGDIPLVRDLFSVMAEVGADFTLTFRGLAEATDDQPTGAVAGPSFAHHPGFDSWQKRWRDRLGREDQGSTSPRTVMRSTNPKYIPRNHRIEAIIAAAIDDGDFAPFHELLEVVTRPFDDQPEMADYALPPQEHERVLRTFCGT